MTLLRSRSVLGSMIALTIRRCAGRWVGSGSYTEPGTDHRRGDRPAAAAAELWAGERQRDSRVGGVAVEMRDRAGCRAAVAVGAAVASMNHKPICDRG
jgi:hypothetical protein